MQFEVPQFTDVESKIFGPFTWKQFVYLAGGGGVAVVLFLVAPFIIFVLIGLPVAALSGALAFVKVNNQPFIVFLEAMYTYATKQKIYFFKQKQDFVYQDKVAVDDVTNPLLLEQVRTNKRGVASLARQLELEAIQK